MKSKHHWKICGNEWSSYLSFSNTHLCSFWNESVWLELAESAVGRVVLLQLLSIHDGAVGVTNLDVMFLCHWLSARMLICWCTGVTTALHWTNNMLYSPMSPRSQTHLMVPSPFIFPSFHSPSNTSVPPSLGTEYTPWLKTTGGQWGVRFILERNDHAIDETQHHQTWDISRSNVA